MIYNKELIIEKGGEELKRKFSDYVNRIDRDLGKENFTIDDFEDLCSKFLDEHKEFMQQIGSELIYEFNEKKIIKKTRGILRKGNKAEESWQTKTGCGHHKRNRGIKADCPGSS